MADRYWVGGSGNWSDAANHWSDSTNGTPGAGFLPTSADDVFFDANSNVGTGTFTVTVDGTSGSPSICKSFSTGGVGGALDGAMTLAFGATGYLDVYGSMTLPATNYLQTGSGGRVTFKSTASGNTFTTNGVIFGGVALYFDGVGGAWTLGSALTFSSSYAMTVLNGTFDTGNYNVTGASIQSTGTGTRSISLGSSTVTLSSAAVVTFSGSNLTFNAGTSTITCSAGGPTFTGGGYTFYTVNFTATTANTSTVITGANTFTNLSQTTPASGLRRITVNSDQTVSGTLTLGATNTAVRRVTLRSDAFGTQRTLTVGTIATLADVDFGDIKAAGASAPWSGTRIGDCGGNNSITATAASDKYWYSATGAGGNWSAAQWETTAGGTTPSVNNFPLPQDTVKFQDTGLSAGNTLTIDQAWNLPAIDGSLRTLAMTLASSTNNPTIFGDLTIVSAMTITGTGTWRFSKQGTQNVTTNGVSVTWSVTVENGTGAVKLIDNFTTSNILNLLTGNLDLNNNTATCAVFQSTNSNTRALAFGTGKIVVTGNNQNVCDMRLMGGFSYTGTSLIEFTYSGATGTRTVTIGITSGGVESNVVNVKVSAGTDTVSFTTNFLRSLDFTGFSGTLAGGARTLYGDLIVSATMTWAATTSAMTFAATSGTQTITTNGVTIDQPMTVNAPGATVKLIDALTIGTTRTFTLTAGTLDLNGVNLSTGVFASSGSTTRAITFGTKKIAITGNAATVLSMGTMTNFSYTGTPLLDLTYSGSTGTRTISMGAVGYAESNVLSLNISAGSDTVTNAGNCAFKNFDTTGFSGTVNLGFNRFYGNVTVAATVTWTGSTNVQNFLATSGTQQITTNGITIDNPFTVNAPGATVQVNDALTIGATRTFTLSAGTLKFKNGTTNTAGTWAFSGTVSTPIVLQSTSAGSRATISQASGTVNSTYLTVKDIVATGGATFNAFTGSGSTTSNNNVNNGNNLGWYFMPPGATFMDFF